MVERVSILLDTRPLPFKALASFMRFVWENQSGTNYYAQHGWLFATPNLSLIAIRSLTLGLDIAAIIVSLPRAPPLSVNGKTPICAREPSHRTGRTCALCRESGSAFGWARK